MRAPGEPRAGARGGRPLASVGTAAMLLLAMPGMTQAFLPSHASCRRSAPQRPLMAASGVMARSPQQQVQQQPGFEASAPAAASSSSVVEESMSSAVTEVAALHGTSAVLSSREEKAKEWFSTVLSGRPTTSPLWQTSAEEALERLSEMRPPTRKDEAFRFTDLNRVYNKQHRTSPLANTQATLSPELVSSIEAKVSEYSLDVCAGQILVFVDGVYRAEVSRTGNLSQAQGSWHAGSISSFPQGEDLSGLLELLDYTPELGMRHTLAAGSVPFVSLNTACLADVACLVTQPRAEMQAPVQFMFVSTTSSEGARVCHPRLLVLARKRSTARFVQTYIDLGEGVSMQNAATTVFCERRAVAEHLHLNEMGPRGHLFDAVSVGTKKLSDYRNVFINVGGETGRINFQATMNGTMGNVETQGLTVTGEEQELDIHSFVHQLRKKGTSNMYQVNIVSGDSHCVFKGRMKLEPKAREVKADQLIRSVMLTGTCTVDAMPTLEVSSGDVDCTHGATVADIDENEAFYLQSRGISRREARQVLMMGQARQIYGSVPDDRLHARLAQRLYDVCPQDEGLRSDYRYLSM